MKWFEDRRKARSEKFFRAGYDYAAGCLLRGEKTREELIDESDNPFDKNEFDMGMQSAVRDWTPTKHEGLEDIRTTLHCMAMAGAYKGVPLTAHEIASCLYAQFAIELIIKVTKEAEHDV